VSPCATCEYFVDEAAEENQAVTEMPAALPAGAARIEDLVQRGPAAPIRHQLSGRGGRPCEWTELYRRRERRRGGRPTREPPLSAPANLCGQST
jgi:hypothetical protein